MTAISSILDPQIRRNICAELLRVLRSPDLGSGKPGGMILWYDFWLNPVNPQTRGVRPAEIKRLFPNCSFEFHKITLAPPIARRVVPVSWILAYGLERLAIFNSHYPVRYIDFLGNVQDYLVAIRPLITAKSPKGDN